MTPILPCLEHLLLAIARGVTTGDLLLTVDEVSGHFRQTLEGGDWSAVPGLHRLRHSFISECASQGIDQRLIDEWVGHQTDEQRRRYRHLYPSVQRAAIRSVFG